MAQQFTNPEVAMEIIATLYYGAKRSASLVEQAVGATGVSEPTVYAVLTELSRLHFVEKEVRSKRNVAYALTTAGRRLLEKERFGVIDHMLTGVRGSKRREVLVEMLLADMLEELPQERRTEEMRATLRRSMADEIDDVKKRMLRLSSLVR